MRKGIFIAIDGLDGSGKATQAKLLAERISKFRKVRTISFPQYGKKSAGAIEEYLSGTYGKVSDTPPEVVSYFFAIDRFDASFQIRKALKNGEVVIADRYTAANIGHKGDRFPKRIAWRRFVRWIYNLEYETFGIPKPNLYFIFMIPAILSTKSLAKRGRVQDILERDSKHLVAAQRSFSWLIEEKPKEYVRIDCAVDGQFRPLEEIHEEIWKKVLPLLK